MSILQPTKGAKSVGKGKKHGKLLPLIILTLLVLTFLWVFLFSGAFSLNKSKVEVVGQNEFVDMKKVNSIIDENVNKQMLKIDTKKIQSQIEDTPCVLSANVLDKWPNGIILNISPCTPTAQIPVKAKAKGEKDGWTLVDQRGKIIRTQDKPLSSLPNLTTQVTDKSAEAVKSMMGVLNKLPKDVYKEVQSVSAESQNHLTSTLKSGITVVWGDSSSLELKIEDVRTLLLNPDLLSGKKTIDVSSPRRPVLR
jgi:cell division protein FtsQ